MKIEQLLPLLKNRINRGIRADVEIIIKKQILLAKFYISIQQENFSLLKQISEHEKTIKDLKRKIKILSKLELKHAQQINKLKNKQQ